MDSFFSFLFNISCFLGFILSMILAVAYFTLLERKVLSAMQCRNGPDRWGLFGIAQPLVDAIKLLIKEFVIPQYSTRFLFLLAPFLVFFLSIMSWAFIPLTNLGAFVVSDYSLLWVLMFSSLNVYALFIAGYASSSRYAFIGSMRSVSQMVSYEIALVILILPIIMTAGSLDLSVIINSQVYHGFSNFSWMVPNAFLFFVCILAETNRAPFDLPEAEAELVAGYNVEYSSFPFALFFLGEYLNMLTMSTLFVSLFWSGWSFSNSSIAFYVGTPVFIFKILMVAFSIIWVRATLPRVRYDTLMTFCWNNCLIFSTAFFMFFISLYTVALYINL